ncbi:MAG TPA: aldo/keto reductase [Vicinamibacterales bacterium]|nr:aldo/keto reductase [Vicinamibacterales bacterium]
MTFALRTIRLGERFDTTALGLGCADLFRVPSRAGRRRVLDAAYDAGIRHFDVAPMYGLGLAESDLGRFARGKRERIVLATKFGIDPAPVGRAIARLQAPISRIVNWRSPNEGAASGGDPRSGSVGSLLYRSNDYSVGHARTSLERSLRALETDHVDVLFIHDPPQASEVPDGIREYLESARAAGRIRAWGVAGEPEPCVDVARRLGPSAVLQVRGDVFSRHGGIVPIEAGRPMILFGVVGRPLRRIRQHLSSDDVRRRWSNAIGMDCGNADAIANLLLRDALSANRRGAVLFSSTNPARIAAAAACAATADDSAIGALRMLIAEELVDSGLRR